MQRDGGTTCMQHAVAKWTLQAFMLSFCDGTTHSRRLVTRWNAATVVVLERTRHSVTFTSTACDDNNLQQCPLFVHGFKTARPTVPCHDGRTNHTAPHSRSFRPLWRHFSWSWTFGCLLTYWQLPAVRFRHAAVTGFPNFTFTFQLIFCTRTGTFHHVTFFELWPSPSNRTLICMDNVRKNQHANELSKVILFDSYYPHTHTHTYSGRLYAATGR